MNEQNSYYAFISCNSADEKWAKWLHHNLEYYHIPTTLCKEYPILPKKIRPIFWYKRDLSGTKLKQALHNKLSSSKYLIVICSPDSAKSVWVNDEIEYFINQGKGNKIIPFIVRGTPHATNPDEECFPPLLWNLSRDEEVRGIDVHREEGKFHALVDVIATMFKMPFDVLWRRHERRRKQIRNMRIAVLLLLMLLILGVYDYTRTKVVYYADYVEGQYLPGQQAEWLKGIGEISSSAIDTTRECFRFEYKRIPLGEPQAGHWQLQCVIHQNVFGNPIGYEEQTTPFVRYPVLKIKYHYIDSLYRPERVECYNEYGNLQRIKKISGENLDKIDFQNFKTELSFNQQTLSEFKDPLLEMLGNKYCNITHFDLSRDKKGNIYGVVFKASNEKNALPMTDTRKHIAMILLHDSIGRIVHVGYQTYEGYMDYLVEYGYKNCELRDKTLWRVSKDRSNNLVQTTIYKSMGNYVEKTVHTESDSLYKRIESYYVQGILSQKRTLKLIGKEVGNMFITSMAELLENVKYDYTTKGYVKRETYLGAGNVIRYCKLYEYNKDNLVSSIKYVVLRDHNEMKPAFGPEGYFRVNNEYKKRLLESQHFQSDKGNYYIHYEYDKNNQLKSASYHNAEKNLANLGDFSKTIAVDNYEASTLASVKELIELKKSGVNNMFDGDTINSLKWKFLFGDNYAKREFAYDDWGNITNIRYFNDKGECYICIEEDILEDGTVPLSLSYIVNQKGHKFPLASSFRSKKGKDTSLINPVTSMILENMIIDMENKKRQKEKEILMQTQ